MIEILIKKYNGSDNNNGDNNNNKNNDNTNNNNNITIKGKQMFLLVNVHSQVMSHRNRRYLHSAAQA